MGDGSRRGQNCMAAAPSGAGGMPVVVVAWERGGYLCPRKNMNKVHRGERHYKLQKLVDHFGIKLRVKLYSPILKPTGARSP